MTSSHRLATVPYMATCPGALIVHADNTVMACTNDDDQDGCRGRDLRHELLNDERAVGVAHPEAVTDPLAIDDRAMLDCLYRLDLIGGLEPMPQDHAVDNLDRSGSFPEAAWRHRSKIDLRRE
jgi:hypothetical protein